MSDLIDRQAAIDEIKTIYEWHDTVTMERLVEHINNLPSRQPEPSTSCSEFPNNSDTVSRQAAIDLFPNDVLEWDTLNGYIAPHVARRLIEQLPPAQTEPKEGRWIPHESPDGGEQYECSRCGVLWEFNDGTPEDNEAYFCPNCGAKMKGEPNE